MENIIGLHKTDVLTHLTKMESNSIHAITADSDLDDLIVQQAYRVLKSGGFLFVMSLPKRMYQDGALLLANKFKIIDSIHWLQPETPDNSFTVGYLIERMTYLGDDEKTIIRENVKDMKIPKLRRCHIPIIVAQKPPRKNQTINQYENGVGLCNPVKSSSGRNIGNVFTTEFGVMPYYFLLPRIKDYEKDLFARAWSHILKQFTREDTLIVDITKNRQAVLPCLLMKRKYQTSLEVKELSPFLDRCASFLTRKKREQERWSISF